MHKKAEEEKLLANNKIEILMEQLEMYKLNQEKN